MKVAVTVDDNGFICSHLGKAKTFQIYAKESNRVKLLEIRTRHRSDQGHEIDEIMDCDAVISGSIGLVMKVNLKDKNIRPIVEEDIIYPLEAVEKMEV